MAGATRSTATRKPASRRPREAGRRQKRSSASHGRLRVRWGRVAVFVLILTAAGLYYAPLQDFFAQQDRYAKERAALVELRRQNRAMKVQIEEMKTKAWVVREARAQLQLVPKGVQAFVVTGLPSGQEPPRSSRPPARQSLGWSDRLRDLLQTLFD